MARQQFNWNRNKQFNAGDIACVCVWVRVPLTREVIKSNSSWAWQRITVKSISRSTFDIQLPYLLSIIIDQRHFELENGKVLDLFLFCCLWQMVISFFYSKLVYNYYGNLGFCFLYFWQFQISSYRDGSFSLLTLSSDSPTGARPGLCIWLNGFTTCV